MNLPPERRI